MISVKNISLELKFSIIMGAAGLFFSFITALASGVPIGVTIIRVIVITIVFLGLGFLIIQIFKRFIPELYEVLSGFGSDYEPDIAMDEQGKDDGTIEEGSAEKTEKYNDVSGAIDEEAEGTSSSECSEIREDELPHIKSGGDGDAFSSGKMGKHILKNGQFVEYEPKILAEAVRTMIKRDE